MPSDRVVLVIPNSRWYDKRFWPMLPPAAPLLSAILRPEFDFAVLDANRLGLDERGCAEHLRALAPRVVLASGLAVEYHRQQHAIMALAKAAAPGVRTVLGGVYPTVLGEEALRDPNVDFIFVGHAEERAAPFLRLVLAGRDAEARALPGIGSRGEGGRPLINPLGSFIGGVATMVKPDYALLDVGWYARQRFRDYQFNSDRPLAAISTSYGCPFSCVFCATRTISGRGVAFRPVADVLEEIETLHREHGVESLVFTDDALLMRRERVVELLEGMIGRGLALPWKSTNVAAWQVDEPLLALMRKSGCTQITVSVESGSPRVLRDIIRKPLKLEAVPPLVRACRRLGIDIGANFVIGFPGESWEEVRESCRFAEACDFDLVHFHIATPLPQTDLYRIAREQGLLPPDFSFTDPRYYGFARAFISTPEWTAEELMTIRAYEWDRINFATPEKAAKIGRMMNFTDAELLEHRRQTRRKIGLHQDVPAPAAGRTPVAAV